MANPVDLVRLQELNEERRTVQAALESHTQNCIATAPHGYAACQLRYERLADRLDQLDLRLKAIAAGHTAGEA